uniref:Reverse transcriptase domain-containing protein n=1 Tax=Leptobrachium leishanense TaxID=445787 RepID=A0A8C5QKU6_9ANUR
MFKPTAPNWRLNDSLLSDPLVAEEGRQVLTDYFERNAVGDVSSPMVWEAHKCVVRGYFIRKGAERAKRCSADIRDLQQQISQVSSDHKRDGDPNTMALLTELRRSLAALLNTRYHRTYLRSKAFFHSHGDKSGRLLARMLAKKRSAAYIAKLRDKQGALQRLPVKLLQIVRDYYAALYDLQGTINPQDQARKCADILSYLTKYSTKKVSRQTSDLLDRPLTIEELALALQTSKTGKSPGPDGLPIRYYKSYAAILFPHLLTALNDLTDGLQLPTQTLSANITILPKEGKDPELCTSYRPISLLNCDLKLFSKILADRLKPFLPALVHADQVGFVPGREARDNTMRTLQLMHHARRSSQALALLSTDAEKAFDRVDWDFISLSLTHIGLGPHLCTWIGALYGNTTARVCVNGVFTTPFAIRNGTRQGCPLSPLLFVVTLEPFLEAIRSNPDISGVMVGTQQHKVAAYADDLLFFVTRPEISLPGVMTAFEEYGRLSNLKINFLKSNILNVTVPEPRAQALRPYFAFKWMTDKIKYLGIWLPSHHSRLYQDNFPPLLGALQRDLANWNYPHIAWLGRIAVVKMNVQPRLLYLMQTIPIDLPKAFFTSLRSMVATYIWRGKRPRLSYEVLTRSRAMGGLALPNFSLYHQACHLQRVVEWSREGSVKLWRAVEQELVGRPLTVLPWLTLREGRRLAGSSPHTQATFGIWRRSAAKLGLTSFPSPMTPVVHNEEYLPGLDPHSIRRLVQVPTPRILHFVHDSTCRPLADLMGDSPISFLHTFHYAQLRHYLDSLPQKHQLGRPLRSFEKLCCIKGPLSHGLSLLYSLLREAASDVPPPYMGKWENMLDVVLSDAQWSKICELIHHCSVSSKTQETAYKVLSLWYRTPDKINRYDPQVPAQCWRCNGARGDMLHIWWECPKLQPFWSRIHDILTVFTDPPPEFTPAAFLLHHNTYSVAAYKRTMAIRILNIAKALVPLYWLQLTPPPLSLWFTRMEELHTVEQLVFSASDRLPQYTAIWSSWILQSSSQAFQALLTVPT